MEYLELHLLLTIGAIAPYVLEILLRLIHRWVCPCAGARIPMLSRLQKCGCTRQA